MAEEKEPKTVKKAKKTAVPEPPPEPKGELPTPQDIRAAKKAELVALAQGYGLNSEGTVPLLRERLLGYIEKATEAAKPKAEEERPPEKKKAPAEAKKKEKAKPPKKGKKPEKGEEEPEEEEEAKVHEARAKPTLDARLQKLLALRAAKNARRPKFRRQEWFRYKMFGDEWRKPQGGQSKLRRHFGYRWNLPSIGYRGPRVVRGLHPSGFQEVLVHNERQLDGLDAKKQAVRIAHGVGSRKRELIEKACDDKGLRVLNRMVTE
jgi:large subunit ribosomal protein L32e